MTYTDPEGRVFPLHGVQLHHSVYAKARLGIPFPDIDVTVTEERVCKVWPGETCEHGFSVSPWPAEAKP